MTCAEASGRCDTFLQIEEGPDVNACVLYDDIPRLSASSTAAHSNVPSQGGGETGCWLGVDVNSRCLLSLRILQNEIQWETLNAGEKFVYKKTPLRCTVTCTVPPLLQCTHTPSSLLLVLFSLWPISACCSETGSKSATQDGPKKLQASRRSINTGFVCYSVYAPSIFSK